MAFDTHSLEAYSLVATAPTPASTGTSLVVTSGQGSLFHTGQNCTVWPIGSQPLTTNSEIVRITNISTDTLTITRIQEGSAARSIIVGDQIANTITPKVLTDIEQDLYQPYKFSVYRNGAWTAANGTSGLVTFDTNSPAPNAFDTSSNYSTSTGKFTAPIAGFYLFITDVGIATTTSGAVYETTFYKNGSSIGNANGFNVGGTSGLQLNSSCLLDLSAGDYIQIYFYGHGEAGATGIGITNFSGFLVSQT